MTAKEYLSQARYLDERIDTKIRQVSQLKGLATKCTATITDMPGKPNQGKSRVEEIVCKIVDLEAEINGDIDRLVDLVREIREVIMRVDSIEEQMLLEKRYLCYESWEKIAVEMNFNIRHIFRLHRESLKKIQIPTNVQ